MNKGKGLRGKLSRVALLSLGFMVLGIGCISWGMFSLWAQSGYPVDVTPNHYSIPAAFAAELNRFKEDSTAVESGHLSAQSHPDKTFLPENIVQGTNVEKDPSLVRSPADRILYPVYPAEGDNIGSLTMPALKLEMPIFQGTGVKELKKGVGHFTQSVLPGEEDNCVLSGHRETFFSQIGKLKIGDQLIVQTSAGTFTYVVKGTRIVHADDKTVIVPTDHAVLTMTTCYPFNTPGYFPDRYIVSAAFVKSK